MTGSLYMYCLLVEQVGEHIGPCLSSLTAGQTVSIAVGSDASLRLYVNDVDCGVSTHDVSLSRCHVVVDLYGRCDRLSVDSSLASPAVCEYQEKAAKENGNDLSVLCVCFTLESHGPPDSRQLLEQFGML